MTTLTLTPGTQGGSDYVTKPSGVASGEAVTWNGTTWARSSVTKIGYSSLSLTGAVLNADLAGSIASTKISGTAVTQADTGTVTSAMIADGTIVNADISASAAIDRSKLTNLGICRFRAVRTSTQSIATATNTKVQLSTETFDPSSVFDSATNYRFTPTTAGKYQINATVGLTSLGDGKYITCQIWKNGSVYSYTQVNNGAAADANLSHVDMVDMNGSTDYIELYISHNHGSNLNTIASQVVLSGHWIGV